ncbi:MAG TPA: NAD(P)-dependent oxidoreductase [Rhizomicrobium sp.]|nr:NAD(P)-dependent oxidoreductase [Rhizomicrobium sp.]
MSELPAKPPAKLSVGVIGIGAFGSKIALRLLWTDFPGLQIYDCDDLTPRFFANNYGGLNVGSPKMMTQNCNVVITALPSAKELREVCFGWEGLATGFKQGGIVIDVGVTDPLETVALANELAAHGVKLVDAPAFGTPDQAKEGKLTLLVGGDDEAVTRCQPLLEKLGSKIIRTGATGSAQAAGAIADYLRAAKLLAASEAIRLGAHFGFEAKNLLEVSDLLGGAELSRVLTSEVVTRRFKSGLQLGVLRANVDLAAQLAQGAGLTLPLLQATKEAWSQAEARLGYGADHSAILKWLETLAADAPDKAEAQPDQSA